MTDTNEDNTNNEEEVDELAEFREADYEERIAAYKEGLGLNNGEDLSEAEKDKELAKVLVPLLALQCYHLPGNTWKQDWIQFVFNNHPILGVCLHHRLHPLGAKTRIVALVGTLVFGLALTAFWELLYIEYPRYQREIWVVEQSNGETWVLTSGMLSMWTVGAAIHTGYNLFMWHLAACSCMREGGCMEKAPQKCHCPSLGKTFLRIFVIITIVLALFVVLLKVIIANDNSASIEEIADVNNYDDAQDFGFVLVYFVGMGLSFFVYYPFGVTVLFSGILGCGKLPVLGGRPREVAIEAKIVARQYEKERKRKEKEQRDLEKQERKKKKKMKRKSKPIK